MCKYCDGLKQMWEQYKELDSKYDILSRCNSNDDSDYFVWCDMQDLLREHSILVIKDYNDSGDIYYFVDGTSFNPTMSDYREHVTSFQLCPMCGKKLSKKRKK